MTPEAHSKTSEALWASILKDAKRAAFLTDEPLRRFVHVDAPPCPVCHRITQCPACYSCGGDGFERIGEVERAYPSSREACAFFAREADQLVLVENAARAIAGVLDSRADGAPTDRIRWKTETERPYGATVLRPDDPALREQIGRLDASSVSLESIADGAITLIACGVPCACAEAEFPVRPPHATRSLGIDNSNRFAEVSIDICTDCGATWLEYFFEDHHNNGSRYRGLIGSALAREVTANTAADLIESLPWYWLGGLYYFGKTHRSSGAISSR